MNKCASFVKNTKTIKCIRCLSTKARQTPAEYCLDLVRKNDHESFLCTLLLPGNVRSAAFAIRAFNVEIALVEDQAKDKTIGRMRYKFWEDALDKVYSDVPPRSPVPLELHRILKRHKLSKRYFKRLISARMERSDVSMFPDLESLEKYSENSTSSIYYLLLEANNTKNVEVDHAASHLGKAHGIATLIRSIPHHAQKRNCVLPQDILMKHDLPMESIFRGERSKALSDAIFDVSSRAKLHLDKIITSLIQQGDVGFIPIFYVLPCEKASPKLVKNRTRRHKSKQFGGIRQIGPGPLQRVKESSWPKLGNFARKADYSSEQIQQGAEFPGQTSNSPGLESADIYFNVSSCVPLLLWICKGSFGGWQPPEDVTVTRKKSNNDCTVVIILNYISLGMN